MNTPTRIPLLRVSQWMDIWDQAKNNNSSLPPKEFYLATMNIKLLRNLSMPNERTIEKRKKGSTEVGYQRSLDSTREKKIYKYLRFGYPLSSSARLVPEDHKQLCHPGWLPTAIIVNVLDKSDRRFVGTEEKNVSSEKLISIINEGNTYYLNVPNCDLTFSNDELRPLEIIDGQHRLIAIDQANELDLDDFENFEVPVVIFNHLASSWQAYLFWVINVEPKKINPSLAYDIYPELRNQNWLESGETIKVYQEHRAQEITEILWRNSNSPWRDRIELFGQRVDGHVSNASFIRSLTASFIRSWGQDEHTGGLFGSIDLQGKNYVIPWKRHQQAAFLIFCWEKIKEATINSSCEWVKTLKMNSGKEGAFSGKYSLLATDQGVRTVHIVLNTVLKEAYELLHLANWRSDRYSEVTKDEDVNNALSKLKENLPLGQFMSDLCSSMIDGKVDWRTSSAPGLNGEQIRRQAAYRGSAGYSLLKQDVFQSLAESKNSDLVKIARKIISTTGK